MRSWRTPVRIRPTRRFPSRPEGPALLDVLRTDLAVWRRIRASAPKPAEIGAAARARAAGDWRSAAAAAHADLEIDLDAIRDRFGREGTERLLDDLHHLSLDLLRWHLPRH